MRAAGHPCEHGKGSILHRWGDDLAIRLPEELAEPMRVKEGDAVEVDIVDGQLVLQPTRNAGLERLIGVKVPWSDVD
ncbi:AbrB/MazE/SpoVT family DNA-binding domain-containing protein [Paraburkholderia sediminicola]|uniref:AbrB/MazE/SpoVT family DNA-binding domain-containing protein n=1 Tax=Paraburkholderia sediminicola TaxID=458836 RepID=UPI0038BE14E0